MGMRAGWFDRNLKWFFTMPAVIFVLVMVVFPIAYTLRISLYEWSMSSNIAPHWVGLDNYKTLFLDERFWHALKTTVYYTCMALSIETILGIAIALLLFREFKGKKLASTLILLPMVATPVAMGLVWMLIYEPTMGVANKILKGIGLKPLEWLGSPTQVIPSLVVIDVWHWTPAIVIIIVAGLTTLPTEPYESAAIDGATGWQKIIHITLPLIRPTIMVAVMLRLIEILKQFDTIYSTTQGGPDSASETLNLFGYVLGFQYFKLGLASALLILFFILVMSFTLAMIWLRRRWGAEV